MWYPPKANLNATRDEASCLKSDETIWWEISRSRKDKKDGGEQIWVEPIFCCVLEKSLKTDLLSSYHDDDGERRSRNCLKWFIPTRDYPVCEEVISLFYRSWKVISKLALKAYLHSLIWLALTSWVGIVKSTTDLSSWDFIDLISSRQRTTLNFY